MPVVNADIDQRQLQARLAEAAERAARRGRPSVASTSFPVQFSDHVALFERGTRLTGDRLFWSSPGGALTLTGLGAAWTVAATGPERFATAAAAWRDLDPGAGAETPVALPGVGPILLGGFAFDDQHTASGDWRDFPAGLLVLPRYLLTTGGSGTWLTVTALVEPDTDAAATATALASDWQRLTDDVEPVQPVAAPGDLVVEDVLPATVWQAIAASLTDAVRRRELEKVVLARAARVEAPAVFDIGLVLRRLLVTNPTCYTFAVARGTTCFLGATPEQLVHLHDGRVLTTALAGSIARGTTAAEDQRLGEDLLASAKDQVEHAIVVRALREALLPLTTDLSPAGSPILLTLAHVQHLRTALAGDLLPGRTVLDVLARLHPSPAVGGYPRSTALALLRAHERLERGWYAGPIGWVDARGEGEFAVGIRSALLEGNGATLFAGCGLVAESEPAREYAETCLKLQPMLSALAGRQP